MTYAWFLPRWAKRLSWTEVAEVFRTTWEHVFAAVEMAVTWGQAHRDLTGITALGIDEIQWHRGHHYLTLVYQLDAGSKRLFWIGEHRTVKMLRDMKKRGNWARVWAQASGASRGGLRLASATRRR